MISLFVPWVRFLNLGYCFIFIKMGNSKEILEIVVCEEVLLLAIKERDIERLDLLLHEDLLFTNPMGETITKKMDMEGYRSGDMKVRHIASQDQIIHIIGDTAVVAVSISLEGGYGGQSLDGEYRYTRVWKNISGSWKVIAGSCVII